jgi:tetratricopeptide (TPR) repeat protein
MYSFFIKKSIYGFGVQWFLISIFFFINIYIPVAGIVADRHTFIASLGYCMVLGAGIYNLSFCKKSNVLYLLLPILMIYTYFSNQRSKDWKDILTLIEADLPSLKNSYDANRIAAQNFLTEANVVNDPNLRQQNLDKAADYALQGLQVYDKEFILHNLLGKMSLFKGDTAKSILYLNKGLHNYKNPEGYTYLGDIYYLNSNYVLAAESYKKGYQLSAHTYDLEYKVVDAYCKAKMYKSADSMNAIIGQNPSASFLPIENKGYIAIYQGDTMQAYTYLSKALEMGLQDGALATKISDYNKRHRTP